MTRREFVVGAGVGGLALVGSRFQPTAPAVSRTTLRRLEYVFPDGNLYVFNIDAGLALVKYGELPMTLRGLRGVCASAATGLLYVSYGGVGGAGALGYGSLLEYDLHTDRIVWTRDYQFGIDSMAISTDGKTIYLPDGELSDDGLWRIIDARDGRVRGKIVGGPGPHNTIVSRDGRRVYMGSQRFNYLLVADTRTRRVIRRIGPLLGGVRPFTINGRETLAYTTATGFLGFQVSNIVTGTVLFTATFPDFGWDPSSYGSDWAPSHGISLAPDETRLYVMDQPNEYVHVFDVTQVPTTAPQYLTSVKLSPMSGTEAGCAYACDKDGWINHSRDGRFVFVGDAGDVIDTATNTVIKTLQPLANTRKYIEVDFAPNGKVAWAATSRSSIGAIT